jgi:hypothetical protein
MMVWPGFIRFGLRVGFGLELLSLCQWVYIFGVILVESAVRGPLLRTCAPLLRCCRGAALTLGSRAAVLHARVLPLMQHHSCRHERHNVDSIRKLNMPILPISWAYSACTYYGHVLAKRCPNSKFIRRVWVCLHPALVLACFPALSLPTV